MEYKNARDGDSGVQTDSDVINLDNSQNNIATDIVLGLSTQLGNIFFFQSYEYWQVTNATLNEDQFYNIKNAFSGDKIPEGNLTLPGCPQYESLSPVIKYKNRGLYNLNNVMISFYNLGKSMNLYLHLTKKYIFENTVQNYWRNINILAAFLTLLVVIFTLFMINNLVIKSIEDMSHMTRFVINPDLKKKDKAKTRTQLDKF